MQVVNIDPHGLASLEGASVYIMVFYLITISQAAVTNLPGF